MNGLGSPSLRYLILDDQAADSALLRQLLLSVDPTATVQCQHSSQGLLPQNLSDIDTVFLANAYAGPTFLPMVQLLALNKPQLQIILCGRSDDVSQQDLMQSAAAGANNFVEKNDLSLSTLHSLLNKQPALLIQTAPPASISETAPAKPSLVNQQPRTEQHDDILQHLQTGIIILQNNAEQWQFHTINPAAAELEQLNADKLLGKQVDAASFDYQNFDLPAALLQLQNGEVINEQALTLDNNGQPHWRDITLSHYGEQIIIELRDTTSAVLAAADTAEYDTLWEDLGRSLPAFCLTLNEDICVDQYLAGDWSQLTAKPETLSGTSLGDLFGADLHEQAERVLNTGKNATQTITLERPQGHLYLQLIIAPMRSAVGLPRRLVLLAHDISEQKIMLESLTADYQAVSEVLQNAPFGVAITDLEGRYERVNSYFEMLCAERTDTIIGQTDGDIFDNKLQDSLQSMASKLVDSGDIQQKTLPLPEADSEQRYRVIKIPLHQNKEQLRAIACIVLPVQIVTSKGKNKKEKKKQASD